MALNVLSAVFLAVTPLAPATPESTAASFLESFKAMDEARFDDFFAADATMFFPDGPFPTGRVEGKDAILSAFHSFFGRVKERGRTSLNISPRDFKVVQYGDVAIVTFWLDGEEAVGRRSIVMRRMGSDWRIAHFHASTAEK